MGLWDAVKGVGKFVGKTVGTRLLGVPRAVRGVGRLATGNARGGFGDILQGVGQAAGGFASPFLRGAGTAVAGQGFGTGFRSGLSQAGREALLAAALGAGYLAAPAVAGAAGSVGGALGGALGTLGGAAGTVGRAFGALAGKGNISKLLPLLAAAAPGVAGVISGARSTKREGQLLGQQAELARLQAELARQAYSQAAPARAAALAALQARMQAAPPVAAV